MGACSWSWGHLPIALLRSAQLTILLRSRRGDSHKLHVSLGHACLELSAEEMISGKAASWQHGSPHAFLCQLNVQDDSHLKLFSKFNILPKTPGLSSTRHLAPPHALVRSPRGAGFRPEILLAAPSRLFEALTHFPLPSGGAASGKTYMEQMPFAPSSTATQCSLLQASWRSLSVFARLAFAVSVCQAGICCQCLPGSQRFLQQTGTAGTPSSATLSQPSHFTFVGPVPLGPRSSLLLLRNSCSSCPWGTLQP